MVDLRPSRITQHIERAIIGCKESAKALSRYVADYLSSKEDMPNNLRDYVLEAIKTSSGYQLLADYVGGYISNKEDMKPDLHSYVLEVIANSATGKVIVLRSRTWRTNEILKFIGP